MDDSVNPTTPIEYVKLDVRSGFALVLGEVEARRGGDGVSMRFRVVPEQLDASGACHPGAIATFADLQLAGLYRMGLLERGHSPTINLGLQYFAPVRGGERLEMDVALIARARDMIFTQALLRGDRGPVARSNALYSAPLAARASGGASAEPQPDIQTLPDGFRELGTGSGFDSVFGPMFARDGNESQTLGFRVAQRHINIHGVVHGGAVATFAGARSPRGGAIVSLSVDYLAPARLGDWMTSQIAITKATRRFVFSQALISTARGPVARASAIHERD